MLEHHEKSVKRAGQGWLLLVAAAAIGCGSSTKVERNYATADLDPANLDFGATYRSVPVEKMFELGNRGTQPLKITAWRIEGSADFFPDAGTAGLLASIASVGEIRIDPGTLQTLGLVYSPVDVGTDVATLFLESDRSEVGEIAVPLAGEALTDLEPVAIFSTGGALEPRATISLDGRASSDPENGPLTYLWRLVPPAGSRAAISWPAQPESSFFADVSGTYRVSLTVYDALHQASPVATQELEILPHDAFRVELSWDLPDVDLDVHLVRESGALWSAEDCFWGNPRPNWNDPLTPNDNPFLELDDEDGYGPEILRALSPGATGYLLYVHAYSLPEAVDTVRFWIRVYIDGVQAASYGPLEMANQFDLSAVARIQYPDTMEELDHLPVTEYPPG